MEEHSEAGWTEGRRRIRYAVVIEKVANNYSAYVPDLPGYVTTGKTRTEATRQTQEAIAFHLEGLREDGIPIPEAQTSTESVEV